MFLETVQYIEYVHKLLSINFKRDMFNVVIVIKMLNALVFCHPKPYIFMSKVLLLYIRAWQLNKSFTIKLILALIVCTLQLLLIQYAFRVSIT